MFPKKLKIEKLYNLKFHLREFSEENKTINLKIYMHFYDYYSIICNSQNMEAT